MIPELAARRAEIEALCRRLGVRRLDVFGSAATRTSQTEGSDLDFLVDFDDAAIESHYADRYFELLKALEELFGRPVDLVVASAIRNPFFRESVERTRVLLFAA